MGQRTTQWRGDIRDLAASDGINLLDEGPRWLVTTRLAYEFGLLLAAIASAWLLVIDEPWAGPASWAIWAWFATDYCVRFAVADDRPDYVRRHRLELLAALPVDVFRPLRLLRLLRPLALLVRATRGLRDVLGLTGVTLIALVGAVVVSLGGALLTWIEPDTTDNFADGLWWSIVTTTTVGYGDIAPSTTAGRVLASVLMLAGIGLLGALTGEVAQRLVTQRVTEITSGNPEIDHLRQRLLEWDELTARERRRVVHLLEAMTDHDPVPDPELDPNQEY